MAYREARGSNFITKTVEWPVVLEKEEVRLSAERKMNSSKAGE